MPPTLSALIMVLNATLSCWAALHVLLNKRDAQAAVLWLIIVFVLPGLGPLVYVALGIDRVGRRAVAKVDSNRRARLALGEVGHPQAEWTIYPLDDPRPQAPLPDLQITLDRLCRHPPMRGNRVLILQFGDEAYPAMLAAIDAAEVSVLLQTYILAGDAVGRRFLAALARAAQRGLPVRLLYDSIGSYELSQGELAEAERAGVIVAAFGTTSRLKGRFQVNLRNHRKLLVTDGALAFTGGMNLCADHQRDQDGRLAVLDYQFQVEGPVVRQLVGSFMEDWYAATGEKLVHACWFPSLRPVGDAICRAIPSGPDGDHGVFHRLLLAALGAARSSVRIASPYFIPDGALRNAIGLACLRGVHVQLLLPSKSDHFFIDQAARSYLDELLEVGVELRLRPPPFMHFKLLVVDSAWACIGSANLDTRSFRLNYELNLDVVDERAVADIAARFDEQLEASTPLGLDQRRRRAWLTRAWENFWALWSPLL